MQLYGEQALENLNRREDMEAADGAGFGLVLNGCLAGAPGEGEGHRLSDGDRADAGAGADGGGAVAEVFHGSECGLGCQEGQGAGDHREGFRAQQQFSCTLATF
jgi:hypothetical protein